MPHVVSSVDCAICGRSLSRKYDMKRHLLKHAPDKEEKKISCPFTGCSYRALHKSNLNVHMTAIHLGLKLFECSLDGCTKAFGEHASLIRHEKCVHGHFRKANPNRKKIHQKYSKAVDMTEMKHALVADASQSISPLVKAPEVHSIQSPPSSSYPYSSSTSALPVSYTWVASIPDQRFDTCLDDHVSLSPAPSCYNYELPQNNSFDGLFPLVRQSAPMANWIELPGIPICGAVLPQQNWLLTPSDVKQFWSTPGPDLSDWTYLRSPCTLGDLAS